MVNSSQLRSEYPGILLLHQANPSDLEAFLSRNGWIRTGESVREVTPAGEGNMNVTRRIAFSSGRTIILKQSLPWVAKYPEIPAPWDRVIREARFYQTVYPFPEVSDAMPQLHGIDFEHRIAALEDLGAASDLTSTYRRDLAIPVQDLRAIANWLSHLHRLPFQDDERHYLPNRDMRALNFEHLFALPFREDNGLDLDAITPGLASAAWSLYRDTALTRFIRGFGENVYLADGPSLLHGDPFPGSFLQTRRGIRVIDPEFAFFGRPEIDVGIFLAHLRLGHHPDSLLDAFFQHYAAPQGFDPKLARKMAAIEILRRLLGVAQLPLEASLEEKQHWIEDARHILDT